MKRTISLMLALVLAFSLAGCGGSESGTGYPEDGFAHGYLGDTMHSYFFDYTVNDAYLCTEFEGYTPSAGNELLVAELTVLNTSPSSITMYDTDFQAQWGEDDDDEAYAFPITEIVSDQQLTAEYDLGIRKDITGLLVFEVPEGYSDFSISYLELFAGDNDEGETGDSFFVYFTPDREPGQASA